MQSGEILVDHGCFRGNCALMLVLLAPVAAFAAEDVAVETARQGDVVEVRARAITVSSESEDR